MEPPSPLSVRATIRCPKECRTNLVARLYVRRLVNQRSVVWLTRFQKTFNRGKSLR